MLITCQVMYIYNRSSTPYIQQALHGVSLLPEEVHLLVLLKCRNAAPILGRMFGKFLVMRVGH